MRLIPVPEAPEAERILYDLLGQRPSYANISHKSTPSWGAHVMFVRSHPYRDWCIIAVPDDVVVGAVYLTHQNEIGISIFDIYWGKGYATEAVKMMMQKHGEYRYLANVAPGNAPSHALFQRLGFNVIQHTYELEAK